MCSSFESKNIENQNDATVENESKQKEEPLSPLPTLTMNSLCIQKGSAKDHESFSYFVAMIRYVFCSFFRETCISLHTASGFTCIVNT
jgi:hypothetical protein